PPADEPPDDPGNPSVNFHGQKRSNATHQSTTDPDARLFRKGRGKEAKLVFMGHALMENRNGLVIDFEVTAATGTAERETAVRQVDEAKQGGFRRTRFLGLERTGLAGYLVAAAYNLVRITRLMRIAAAG